MSFNKCLYYLTGYSLFSVRCLWHAQEGLLTSGGGVVENGKERPGLAHLLTLSREWSVTDRSHHRFQIYSGKFNSLQKISLQKVLCIYRYWEKLAFACNNHLHVSEGFLFNFIVGRGGRKKAANCAGWVWLYLQKCTPCNIPILQYK